MSTYTEHVTRIEAEDTEHPGIGTVAVLRIAPPEGEDRRPATLGPRGMTALADAVGTALDRAEAGEVAAIALTGTGRVFLAGADLSLFADDGAAGQVVAMTSLAHGLHRRVRAAGVPVLAHLNGAALGGGLEMALLADVRTAAPGVRGIALPETGLGILPGWGGTTLLGTVVGAEVACRMILEDPARDRRLDADEALAIGLVDAVVEDLDAALDTLAAVVSARRDAGSAPDGTGATGEPRFPDAEEIADALAAPAGPGETRRERAARLEREGAPATARALELLEHLPGSTLEDALAREAFTLHALVVSPSAAASLYAAALLRAGRPGRSPVPGARELRRVGVAGAGLMAAQIGAQLALGLRVPVVLRDLDADTAQAGLAHAREVVAEAAARGRIAEAEAAEVSAALSATDDVHDLAGCDLVLEAVPEVLAIKRAVLAELEGVLAPDALLASNTSSLSLTAMAEGLAHPERVLGLHFFNPVARMPLVEVVHTADTDGTTRATGLEVVRRLGKIAVRSADAPGFIVNRLLFRVLGAVLASLDAGADPAEVDASLDPLGLPMRPLALLDLVGLGVADHVGAVLADGLGDRFHRSAGLHAMAEAGHHVTERSRTALHPPVAGEVARVFREANAGNGDDGHVGHDGHEGQDGDVGSGGGTGSAPTGDALLTVVLDGLAEEVALLLDEGVVRDVREVDLAMMLGAGFPRHRGGLTPHLDRTGASERAAGRRFHPGDPVA